VVAQEFNGLIQQLALVLGSGRGVPATQPDEDLFLRFFAHIAVHVG
jgi:hypothetical protein